MDRYRALAAMAGGLAAVSVGLSLLGGGACGGGVCMAPGAAHQGAQPASKAAAGGGDAKPASTVKLPPVVVVELFTSEGCSSCPPADQVMNELAKRAAGGKAETGATGAGSGAPRIIVLSHHVDYWDRLGWKDRFSSADATARQREYVVQLKLRGAYTPQAVVNGRSEFVGSDAKRLEREVAQAGRVGATIPVNAAAEWKAAASGEAPSRRLAVSVRGAVDSVRPGTALLADVVIVENGLESKVTRGENSGETLKHDRVVRSAVRVPVSEKGEAAAELEVPADADLKNCRVVVVARDVVNRGVVGAVELELPAVVLPKAIVDEIRKPARSER